MLEDSSLINLIDDWSITHSTLEEVFLSLTHKMQNEELSFIEPKSVSDSTGLTELLINNRV